MDKKEKKIGKLIAASLGPGDPGLISRAAWAELQSGSCWLYPTKKIGASSFALGIVERAGLEIPTDAMALVFPMTHDVHILSKYWVEAAHKVLELLHSGQDAVFLVEGDASTYSTFGHLSRTIHALDESIEIEVIAGVTSYSAAASCVLQPLTEADDTLAVIPAGYGIEVIAKLLSDFDTLVLMKVKPLIIEIINLIEDKKLLSKSYFIERAGTPDERIITDLLQLRDNCHQLDHQANTKDKVHYLSLLVIHNPYREHPEIQRGCGRKPQSV
ncbi:MAG: precorrin-2 C(20)-methyltransferase [Pseudomonadota bacterium]